MRRDKIAILLERGITNQFEICRQLGMDVSQRRTVGRDIEFICNAWRERTVQNVAEAKGREIARLDSIYLEASLAFERSKIERQSSRASTRNRQGGAETVAEMRKEQRDGDPRFQAIMLKACHQLCALKGLNEPIKVIPLNPDGMSPWTPILKDISDEELALLEKLAERARTVSAGEATPN